MRRGQIRIYNRNECVAFSKTKEVFGGLSNMAAGFPLCVNGARIRTSEALYQACRYPHRPDIQQQIIDDPSPMTAKMKSRSFRHDSRPDWERVRVKIMRWCLQVKLVQNWSRFSVLLLETGEQPIVEESRKDDFWGAKATADGTLVGMNVLGRLLMELRESVKEKGCDIHMEVQPLSISDFRLGGQPIPVVRCQAVGRDRQSTTDGVATATGESRNSSVKQPTLFDAINRKQPLPIVPAAVYMKPVGVMDLKTYPEYKESGQVWLGQVPAHWSLLPNRAIFEEVKDRNHPDEEMLSVTITKGIVRQKALLEGSSKKDSSNLDRSAYKLVQPRDIAYNKMRAWQGAIGASTLQGIISPAYVVMRFRNDHNVPSFFHKLYRTPQFAKEAERWSYGITSDMWSLRPEHFKMIYTPIPPPDEQAAIVRFLDWANGRLERAIRAKRKIIALLNEQKQAIIHRAVTRGLDPNVPLKPSGIPWLGDIPEHWEVRRLKFLASDIVDCLHATPRYSDSGTFPAIRTADIAPGFVNVTSAKRISSVEYLKWTTRMTPIEGDILYTREGERFGIAACVPPNVTLCISQRMMVFRIKAENCSNFVMMLLNSQPTYGQALQDALGATVPHVNISTIRNYFLALPKKLEQEAIVTYIHSLLEPVSSAEIRLEREIELLREYRTRLVADVVTGKLDVRAAAAKLPDEVPLETVEEEALAEDETEIADEEAIE